MLKDKIKNKLIKKDKNYFSQSRLTCQARNPGHEIMITP